jgi:hypothetical protein
VNDIKGTSWPEFKSLVLRLVDLVDTLYPKTGKPLNFIKAELRSINGIPFKSSDPLTFLSEKLHINIGLPNDILQTPRTPSNIGLNLAYPLTQPEGNLLMSVNLGQMESSEAYILQSVVQSAGEATPQNASEFESWVVQANEVSHQSIESLCKGLLIQQVKGGL